MNISGVSSLSQLVIQHLQQNQQTHVDADGDHDGDVVADTNSDSGGVKTIVSLSSNIGKNINFYA